MIRHLRNQNLDTEDALTIVDCGRSFFEHCCQLGVRSADHELRVLELHNQAKTKTVAVQAAPESFRSATSACSLPLAKAPKSKKRKKKSRKK